MESKMPESAKGKFIGFYLPKHVMAEVQENASIVSLQCLQDTLLSPAEHSLVVLNCVSIAIQKCLQAQQFMKQLFSKQIKKKKIRGISGDTLSAPVPPAQ